MYALLPMCKGSINYAREPQKHKHLDELDENCRKLQSINVAAGR